MAEYDVSVEKSCPYHNVDEGENGEDAAKADLNEKQKDTHLEAMSSNGDTVIGFNPREMSLDELHASGLTAQEQIEAMEQGFKELEEAGVNPFEHVDEVEFEDDEDYDEEDDEEGEHTESEDEDGGYEEENFDTEKILRLAKYRIKQQWTEKFFENLQMAYDALDRAEGKNNPILIRDLQRLVEDIKDGKNSWTPSNGVVAHWEAARREALNAKASKSTETAKSKSTEESTSNVKSETSKSVFQDAEEIPFRKIGKPTKPSDSLLKKLQTHTMEKKIAAVAKNAEEEHEERLAVDEIMRQKGAEKLEAESKEILDEALLKKLGLDSEELCLFEEFKREKAAKKLAAEQKEMQDAGALEKLMSVAEAELNEMQRLRAENEKLEFKIQYNQLRNPRSAASSSMSGPASVSSFNRVSASGSASGSRSTLAQISDDARSESSQESVDTSDRVDFDINASYNVCEHTHLRSIKKCRDCLR
jgi:hypothetical protein